MRKKLLEANPRQLKLKHEAATTINSSEQTSVVVAYICSHRLRLC